MVRTRLLCGLAVIALCVAATPAVGQFGRFPIPGRSTYPGGRSGTGLPPAVPGAGSGKQRKDKEKAQEPLGTFSGTLKGLSSKSLTIEEDNSNTVQFYCNKKTKYYDGSKKIKASKLKSGNHVLVEARKGLEDSLEAVNVRLGPSTASARKSPEQ